MNVGKEECIWEGWGVREDVREGGGGEGGEGKERGSVVCKGEGMEEGERECGMLPSSKVW